VKPVSKLFARLHARHDEKDLEKAGREGFEAGRRHAEIIGRVEWTKAALATAEKTGDPALIQKATENALAAAAELNERVRAAAVAFSRAVRLNGTQSRAPSCRWELASYVRQTPADAP
jgi:hypothetical protein